MKHILTSLLSLVLISQAYAQDFKTAYFLENYVYAYRSNPAAPISGKPYTFVGVGFGNLGADLNLMSYIQPFKLQMSLDAQAQANMNVLTIGHQSQDSRWSIEMNLRTNNFIHAPVDLKTSALDLLSALGVSSTSFWNQTYNLAGVYAGTETFSEFAFGYSRRITDNVTVGGRLKFLLGLGSSGVGADLSITPRSFPDGTYSADFELRGMAKTASPWGPDTSVRVPGFGGAADFGISVEATEGLTLSASLLDLGFIYWNGNLNSTISLSSEGLRNSDMTWDSIRKALTPRETTRSGYGSWLGYTVHLGAEYKMPFYRRLSVSGLASWQARYNMADSSWLRAAYDYRLGIAVCPIDQISFALSAAATSFGGSLGAVANFKLPFVSFYAGFDALTLPLHAAAKLMTGRYNTMITAGLLLSIDQQL